MPDLFTDFTYMEVEVVQWVRRMLKSAAEIDPERVVPFKRSSGYVAVRLEGEHWNVCEIGNGGRSIATEGTSYAGAGSWVQFGNEIEFQQHRDMILSKVERHTV